MSRGRTTVTVGRSCVECRDHRTSQYVAPKEDPHRLPVSTQGAQRTTRDGGSRITGASPGVGIDDLRRLTRKRRGGDMRRGRCRGGHADTQTDRAISSRGIARTWDMDVPGRLGGRGGRVGCGGRRGRGDRGGGWVGGVGSVGGGCGGVGCVGESGGGGGEKAPARCGVFARVAKRASPMKSIE